MKPKKSCAVCGKGRVRRNLISHSKRLTIDYAHPNLRRMRILRGRTVVAVWVCTKCLKKGRVRPAPRRTFTKPAPAG